MPNHGREVCTILWSLLRTLEDLLPIFFSIEDVHFYKGLPGLYCVSPELNLKRMRHLIRFFTRFSLVKFAHYKQFTGHFIKLASLLDENNLEETQFVFEDIRQTVEISSIETKLLDDIGMVEMIQDNVRSIWRYSKGLQELIQLLILYQKAGKFSQLHTFGETSGVLMYEGKFDYERMHTEIKELIYLANG